MGKLNKDQLRSLAMEPTLFASVQQELRGMGREDTADELIKLKQDVTLELAGKLPKPQLSFGAGVNNAGSSGVDRGDGGTSRTDALEANYEPTSAERLYLIGDVLIEVSADDGLKTTFKKFLYDLNLPLRLPVGQPIPGSLPELDL